MIYIVIPHFDRIKNIPKLIERLSNQTVSDFKLIIVDHGNTSLSPEYLPDFCILLRGSTEQWWSGAMNVGIKYVLSRTAASDDDFILFQNDDVDFAPSFLEDLLKAHEDTGAIVSAITLERGTGVVLDAANRLSFAKARHVCAARGLPIEELNEAFLDSDVLKGRGVLYPIRVVKEIGLIEERLHYRADPEYSYRAKRRGYRLSVATGIRVETTLDTQESNYNAPSLRDFMSSLMSKRNPQNLPAAWIYFSKCFGHFPAFYCISFHFLWQLALFFRSRFRKSSV